VLAFSNLEFYQQNEWMLSGNILRSVLIDLFQALLGIIYNVELLERDKTSKLD